MCVPASARAPDSCAAPPARGRRTARRERLLDQHVLARLQRRLAQRVMRLRRRRDHDGLDRGVLEHWSWSRRRTRVAASEANASGSGSRSHSTPQVEVADFGQVAGQVRPPVAAADDRRPDRGGPGCKCAYATQVRCALRFALPTPGLCSPAPCRRRDDVPVRCGLLAGSDLLTLSPNRPSAPSTAGRPALARKRESNRSPAELGVAHAREQGQRADPTSQPLAPGQAAHPSPSGAYASVRWIGSG